jgi:hypothetical protein
MPWNSLTSTTAIAVIQDLLIEQLEQATPEAEEEREAMVQDGDNDPQQQAPVANQHQDEPQAVQEQHIDMQVCMHCGSQETCISVLLSVGHMAHMVVVACIPMNRLRG